MTTHAKPVHQQVLKETLSTPKRRGQRERHQTKGLINEQCSVNSRARAL